MTDFAEKKIVVAGIGGVGGLLGACLAKAYPKVYFYARGKKKTTLCEKGITLNSEALGQFNVKPFMVTDDAKEIGSADILIICVKNYSLQQLIGELKCIVSKDTIVIPVMNGVEHGEICRENFPFSKVADALIYTISGCDEDCVVTQKGAYSNVHLGTMYENEDLKKAVLVGEELFKGAGVTCIVEENINTALWKKYLFNCAFNILTAAYKANVGDLRADPLLVEDMENLLNEGLLIARRNNVSLPVDFVAERMHFFKEVQSPEGTSSMRRDMDAGRPTELETFSGYLLRQAEELGLYLPRTRHYYNRIKAMLNPEADAPAEAGPTDLPALKEELKKAYEVYGKNSKQAATVLYQMGLYYVNHGDAFAAMDYLGDSLYIRKSFYDDESLRIKEILRALEITTFM